MTSPLPEQEGSKRRLMYAFELADLIGAKMTPEMMYVEGDLGEIQSG